MQCTGFTARIVSLIYHHNIDFVSQLLVLMYPHNDRDIHAWSSLLAAPCCYLRNVSRHTNVHVNSTFLGDNTITCCCTTNLKTLRNPLPTSLKGRDYSKVSSNQKG